MEQKNGKERSGFWLRFCAFSVAKRTTKIQTSAIKHTSRPPKRSEIQETKEKHAVYL